MRTMIRYIMGQFDFLFCCCIIECSFEINPNIMGSLGHVNEESLCENPQLWYVDYVHWQGKVHNVLRSSH